MKRNNKTQRIQYVWGYRSWCSVVFIGRSFTLVFNLGPRLRVGLLRRWRRRIVSPVTPISNSCSIIFVELIPIAMVRKRMAKYIALKLPGTFDNLSVCMFYRFRQVQTELSDVKLDGELNHPKANPILNMYAALVVYYWVCLLYISSYLS